MRRTFKCGHAWRFRRRLIPGCGLAVLVMVIAVSVQAQEPVLVVGNVIPVNDPLGRAFKGTNGSPEVSARVEIRATFGGAILSPTNEEAQLDFFNPLMRVSYIGHDVPIVDSGLFSETFASNELHSATSYYARVFDWTSRDTSIYYADSLPFSGMPSGTINPEFGALTLTGPDSDGDGLPDAWEMENGLNPGEPDTDGDGYDDWFEAIHGDYMQSTEPDPELVLQINPPHIEADPYTVSWWTIPVPGMTYYLQYRPQMPQPDEDDGYAFSNVWNGAATDTLLDIDVQDWVGTNVPPKGFFRVTVPYSKP